MLIEPTHKSKLPDGAKIWIAEKGPFGIGDKGGFRVIVFDVDGETGAMCVDEIAQSNTIAGAVDTILNCGINGIAEDNAWVPVEHTEPGPYYLQSDCVSLTEALEAAIGIPPNRSDPVPLSPAEQLIEDIKGALGTEEDGEALVEVARNAHRAEQELAAITRRLDEQSAFADEFFQS